ncbi:MAG: hypothetical protein JXR50_00775 [Prolixibacteraceae bacterium]|nr:hypothetical protein [Prolixibacteraceae bacterium]MBN2648255.1 hypothetical protein [Prolixibacteraceae bacterium]
MKALLSGKKSAAVASLLGIIGYFVFDFLKARSSFGMIDFFRGFFTGITLVAVIMLIGLYFPKVLKRRKNNHQ